eukprot:gene585-630_t
MSEVSVTFNNYWDGRPSPYERYAIELRISPESGDVLVHIDAPYHNDPPPDAPPGRFEELSDYEVVELFISSQRSDVTECPYLEVQVGPHGHYMLIFFMGEADWEDQDPTLDLDQEPLVHINKQRQRWTADLAIPAHFLPEPDCKADLSVNWNFNACAIFGKEDRRRYLSYHALSGDQPNFHQLRNFQPIRLFETLEVREVVDRMTISIVNEKRKLIQADHNDSSSRLQGNRLQDGFSYDTASSSTSSGLNPVACVIDVARAQQERVKREFPQMGELEEKFARHIQQEYGEFVIVHSKIWKRKGLSFKKRTLILTSKPRLLYLDGQGAYKGSIPWTMAQRIKIHSTDRKHFEITVPENGRVYHLFDGIIGAQVWVDAINALLNAQRDYLHHSRKL